MLSFVVGTTVNCKIIIKSIPTIFLQAVVGLIGIVALAILIRLPLTEGRAAGQDLFHIYTDPFILYGYAASIVFFIALYKAFRLLGFIRQNKLYSADAARALKTIKYCAVIFGILIALAGSYIRLSHHQEDDPAGFLAVCAASVFASMALALVALRFEKKVRKAITTP